MKFKVGDKVYIRQYLKGRWKHGGDFSIGDEGVIEWVDPSDSSYSVRLSTECSSFWFNEKEIHLRDDKLSKAPISKKKSTRSKKPTTTKTIPTTTKTIPTIKFNY